MITSQFWEFIFIQHLETPQRLMLLAQYPGGQLGRDANLDSWITQALPQASCNKAKASLAELLHAFLLKICVCPWLNGKSKEHNDNSRRERTVYFSPVRTSLMSHVASWLMPRILEPGPVSPVRRSPMGTSGVSPSKGFLPALASAKSPAPGVGLKHPRQTLWHKNITTCTSYCIRFGIYIYIYNIEKNT